MLILTGAGEKAFVAGADIGELATFSTLQAKHFSNAGHTIIAKLQELPIAVIAAVNGFCLGGGLELALACRYRIARDDDGTRLGLPEVRLGIHPGFGGSVRAVRLLGGLKALDLMLSGRTVSSRQARSMGLVDYAVPERHLLTAARETLLKPPSPHTPGRLDRLTNHPLVRPLIAPLLKRKVAQHARPEHYPGTVCLDRRLAQACG